MLTKFLAFVLFFHLSEFTLAWVYTPNEVGINSFLLSRQYLIAMSISLLEYILELYYLSEIKNLGLPRIIGFLMVATGEVIRKAAYITARHNFTHDIKVFRRRNHVLVRHGIYKWIRHPGYAGWFIWSVGTQVMLCNPFCIVAFAIVSWKFFAQRIPYEEYHLRQFFGIEYERYAESVPSGLPFIP